MVRKLTYALFSVCLLVLTGCTMASAGTPAIQVSLDSAKYCATARQGDAFTGVAPGACVVGPPIIPPVVVANQLKVSSITYGPYLTTARPNVNVTEWVNIWGHSNTTDAASPWPGNSGAGPVIRGFNRSTVLIAHFHTGAVVRPGFFTYARNFSQDILHDGIDISISKIAGDFTPNGGATNFNALPTDQTVLSWRGTEGNPASYAILWPNSDYYVNVKAHFTDPVLGAIPLYMVAY